jgi:hypothetical protein
MQTMEGIILNPAMLFKDGSPCTWKNEELYLGHIRKKMRKKK